MRKQLRILALILAIPPLWVALAAPRDCAGCLPFKLVAWEAHIAYVERLLENLVGSLARPPSLVELMLGDMVVGQEMLDSKVRVSYGSSLDLSSGRRRRPR